MSQGGFVSNFEWKSCFLHSPRSYVGDVLWNSEPDSRGQFSHCFWSFWFSGKCVFVQNVLKRIIQNTPQKGPVFGHMASCVDSKPKKHTKMGTVNMICSQRPANRLCAWQVRKQVQVFGNEPLPAAQSALRLAILHHSRGSHFAWPGYLRCMSFLFARSLHLPARTLPSFVCLPACLCWQIPRACESV